MKEVNGSIWHTMSTQRVTPTDFVCVIEISKGSKNKYELDKEMRPTKFPEIPVSLERNTEVFRHPLL